MGLTEAVKQAVGNELKRASEAKPLIVRIREFQDKVLSRPPTGLQADKAFYDWLSEEDGE